MAVENTIVIGKNGRKAVLLPMRGTDREQNIYEVDSIGFLKNGRRFIPLMGEFHFSRYTAEEWEEELLKMENDGEAEDKMIEEEKEDDDMQEFDFTY